MRENYTNAFRRLIRVWLAKLATPLANSLISYLDPTFTEEFLHIPETHTEPKIQPDSVADNLCGKAVILILGGRRHGVHALITSYLTTALQASQEVDNAHWLVEGKWGQATRSLLLLSLVLPPEDLHERSRAWNRS